MFYKRTFALSLLRSEPPQHVRAEAPHWWCYLLVLVATAAYCPAVGLAQGQPTSAQFAEARSRLVDEAIIGGGIKNKRVVKAIGKVPRHQFVAKSQLAEAYHDTALPIGHGQTISPPYIVAYMTEQLDPQAGDKVLEIGTGSGYQAAVLSELVAEVYTIEIVEPLGRKAAQTLKEYKNVHPRIGDGYEGWPEHAPFDKIIVTCSPEKVPAPLVEQLKEGGRLVVPVGERFQQMLYLYKKVDGELQQEALQTTFFVPMTGEAEALRVVQADSTKPAIVNGSFEETIGDTDLPTAWYYVRQAKVEQDRTSPEGKQHLRFTNDAAWHSSKAVQAIGIDGKVVHELDISFQFRGGVARRDKFKGQEPPGFFIEFYDNNRKPISDGRLELWPRKVDWSQGQLRVKVPQTAILGVIRIGLGQAAGELSFDDIELHPLADKP
jgi:protein-L-isoaspartate(D-aspartate) O-methyltransferase